MVEPAKNRQTEGKTMLGFFWKQNKTTHVFSATRSQREVFYNYTQHQKRSDVMGVRKIHPKLYHISIRRFISVTMSFLGSSKDVQPLLGTGQQVWLRRHSGHKWLGSQLCTALTWRQRHWLPSHQLSQGPSHPLPRGFIDSCGSSKGFDFRLWAYFWLPKELYVLLSSSKLFCAAWRHQLQCIHSGELMSVWVPLSPSTSIQNSVQNSNSSVTKDFCELGLFSAKLLHSVKFIHSPRKLYETRLDWDRIIVRLDYHLVRTYFVTWWITFTLYNLYGTSWLTAIFLLETIPSNVLRELWWLHGLKPLK